MEKLRRIRSNDPSFTRTSLNLEPFLKSPSFYIDLVEALKNNTYLTELFFETSLILPNLLKPDIDALFPVLAAHKITLVFGIFDNRGPYKAGRRTIFDTLIKMMINEIKVRKLLVKVKRNTAEGLAKYLSVNWIENIMLNLILKRKIGMEAASKISDELFPTDPHLKEFYPREITNELFLPSLNELHLEVDTSNDLCGMNYGRLWEAIGKNTRLKRLSLAAIHVNANKELSFALEKVFEHNTTLKSLKLFLLHMNDTEYLAAIALALKSHTSLSSITFDLRCQSKFEKRSTLDLLQPFLEGLRYQTASIDLRLTVKGNHVEDETLYRLAILLSRISNLQKLKLQFHFDFTEKELKKFAEAITLSKSIKEISIGGFETHQNTLSKLEEFCSGSSSLESISFHILPNSRRSR